MLAFNPAISVNGLFLGFYTSDPLVREPAFGGHDHGETDAHEDEAHTHGHSHGLPEDTGLSVQEAEVCLSSSIDAYLKGDLTLAIPGSEGLELEEGYVTSLGLRNVTLKAGKFFTAFARD